MSDEPKVYPDDPETDGTDFAHPAWWRGQDHTMKVVCQHILEILKNPAVVINGGGRAAEPWHSVRLAIAVTKMNEGCLMNDLAEARAEIERLKKRGS